MTSKKINTRIMYFEIQKLYKIGFRYAGIGRRLDLDSRTVKEVLSFSETEYESYLKKLQNRTLKLDGYEDFIRLKL